MAAMPICLSTPRIQHPDPPPINLSARRQSRGPGHFPRHALSLLQEVAVHFVAVSLRLPPARRIASDAARTATSSHELRASSSRNTPRIGGASHLVAARRTHSQRACRGRHSRNGTGLEQASELLGPAIGREVGHGAAAVGGKLSPTTRALAFSRTRTADPPPWRGGARIRNADAAPPELYIAPRTRLGSSCFLLSDLHLQTSELRLSRYHHRHRRPEALYNSG